MKKPLLILLLSAGLAASCIYPFEAAPDSDARDALVVEGDIIVGGMTDIALSSLRPLSDERNSDGSGKATGVSAISVLVEDESGAVFKPSALRVDGNAVVFTLDTRECNPELKHRLSVSISDDRYATDWLEVHISPVIDSISVNPDSDRGKMFIGLSCHSDEERYFRWKYSETWEYHAYEHASYKYEVPVKDTPSWNNGYGIITTMYPEESTYLCWNSTNSSEVMLFSTEHQSDNRFVDLDFLSIPQDSDKLMSLYHIKISVQSLSEDAYRYWETLNSTSSQSGDLFTPMPSEIEGNIKCLTDKDKLVIGYISASTDNSVERFVDNAETKFYRRKTEHYPDPEVFNEKDWLNMYRLGWRPCSQNVDDSGRNVIEWVDQRCVDCRLKGGSTQKPEFWPN